VPPGRKDLTWAAQVRLAIYLAWLVFKIIADDGLINDLKALGLEIIKEV
jgi:hypothetical protein